MHIPFVDLKAQYFGMKQEIDEAISEVITQTAFIGGEPVQRFERQFAELYGVKHCISVANGTDAIYIALKMLGIGEGDEVITVANSWISSSETISQTGARPVFVDIHPDFYSIDEEQLEASITTRTKAIIPVHLQGQMCRMDVIQSIAEKYKLPIIEDCAQSHFSEFDGIRAGLFGVAGTFSFYPSKNLGAYGDAGCIVTNDDEFALKCRMYARHGALKKHQHLMEGINSRMDGLQAAVLSTKLPYILDWTERRIQHAAYYTERLHDVEGITVPVVRPNSKHTFHLYVVRTAKRDELAQYLSSKGIQTAIHYPVALPNLSAYDYLGHTKEDYPIASKYQDEILSLPMFPELTTEQIDYITDEIRNFMTTSN